MFSCLKKCYVRLFFANLIALLRDSDAKILTGELITNRVNDYFTITFFNFYYFNNIIYILIKKNFQNWAFLARFCFLSDKGKFKYDFVIRDGDTEANLLLYYDSPSQWPSVYPSNKSCLERESVLRRDLGQIVSLSPHSAYTGITGCLFTNENRTEVRCNSYREFRSSRPRWWFIAISECHSDKGLNISYYISLTNAEPGSFWREHFSADEFCNYC